MKKTGFNIICSVKGCGNYARTKGVCHKHRLHANGARYYTGVADGTPTDGIPWPATVTL